MMERFLLFLSKLYIKPSLHSQCRFFFHVGAEESFDGVSRSMITYTPSRGRVRIRWSIFQTRWLLGNDPTLLVPRAVTRKKLIISVNPAWLMRYRGFRGLPSVHLRDLQRVSTLKSVQILWIRISVIRLDNILPWFKAIVDFFFLFTSVRNRNAK